MSQSRHTPPRRGKLKGSNSRRGDAPTRPRGNEPDAKGTPRPPQRRDDSAATTLRLKRDTLPRPTPRRSEGDRRKEVKYYGVAACLALWQKRPQDVIRIYLEERCIPQFAAMLRWAAAERKAYHMVQAEDLERLTESIHHQGVCVLAREPEQAGFADLLHAIRGETPPNLIAYLDGVENPHNLGAILRTCAHFGVRYVLGAQERLPRLSPSACRVAEGGAEEVALIPLGQPHKALRQLQRLGYTLVGTAAHQGGSLYRHHFGERTVLIMGAESSGVSEPVFDAADILLRIPGTGAVDSLNVSVAFAVAAAEHYRQRLAHPALARAKEGS